MQGTERKARRFGWNLLEGFGVLRANNTTQVARSERMMPHVTSKSWTPEQEAKLQKLIESGASAFKAAAALKRSIISVQAKARQFGTPFPHKRAVRKARLAREADHSAK